MSTPSLISFERHDVAPLARAVEQVLRRGRGWLNVQPDLDGVDPRAVSRPSIFSGRGRTIPLGTFVPASGSGMEHEWGMEHGAGKHAVQQLRDAGLTFPDGARLVQDHPRRGLVLAIPVSTSPTAIAELLVGAATQLTVVPVGDRWIAEVFD
jgi:hypothetical protein